MANIQPTQVARPNPRSTKELGELYGVTYDQNAIKSVFDEATNAEYKVKEQEYGATERDYYRNLSNAQDTALDTIRRSNAASVATGASRGMQAANELASVLGLQQEASAGATELADAKNRLVSEREAALAQNAMNAFNQSNQMGLQLGNLSNLNYAADVQLSAAEMQKVAQEYAAQQNLQGMLAGANATKYAADKGTEGQKYYYDAIMNQNQKQEPNMVELAKKALDSKDRTSFELYAKLIGYDPKDIEKMWKNGAVPTAPTTVNNNNNATYSGLKGIFDIMGNNASYSWDRLWTGGQGDKSFIDVTKQWSGKAKK